MPKKSRRPTAPKHLSKQAANWWRSVVAEFTLDDSELMLLQLACEAFDRAENARIVIDEHGPTFTDRWGQPKPRPECVIERDARAGFAKLVAELRLTGTEHER